MQTERDLRPESEKKEREREREPCALLLFTPLYSALLCITPFYSESCNTLYYSSFALHKRKVEPSAVPIFILHRSCLPCITQYFVVRFFYYAKLCFGIIMQYTVYLIFWSADANSFYSELYNSPYYSSFALQTRKVEPSALGA